MSVCCLVGVSIGTSHWKACLGTCHDIGIGIDIDIVIDIAIVQHSHIFQ